MRNSVHMWLAIVILIGVVAIGYAMKWSVIVNYWWILLFLLCPLMHLFMGHGSGKEKHGDHGKHGYKQTKNRNKGDNLPLNDNLSD